MWQHFYEQTQNKNFELVAVALETQGAAAARPWVERANATFPVVVDQHNVLGRMLGFKAVPNGVFLNEQGVICYAKYGGFSVEQPQDREAIRQLIDGEIQQHPAVPDQAPYLLSSAERQRVETQFRHGAALLEQGQREAALAEWKHALELDPQNYVIRKQIWAVKYPERFYPTIDWDWQRDQLQYEQEQEIASGVCGLDGCPIPRSLPT